MFHSSVRFLGQRPAGRQRGLTRLHHAGNFAQASNGGLFLISRNCLEGDLNKCQMAHDDGPAAKHARGIGNHQFVCSISDDVSGDCGNRAIVER